MSGKKCIECGKCADFLIDAMCPKCWNADMEKSRELFEFYEEEAPKK